MGDSYSDPQQNERGNDANRDGSNRGGFRGGRGPGNREGGFRIRLSDNEMRAARSLQEAFNLRSTVAVLGFALRTLGQMLDEGKLEDLVAQSRSQGTHQTRREDGPRKGRFNDEREISHRGPKPNPFARPEKPQTPTTPNTEKASEVFDENLEVSKTKDEVENTEVANSEISEIDPKNATEA